MEQSGAQAYFDQAAQLTRAARHDEAAVFLLRAIEADPRKFEFYSRLTNISRRVSDKAPVIAALRNVIQKNPHSVPAFRALATYCSLMPDIPGATEALRAGVRAKHLKQEAELSPDGDAQALTTPDFIIIGAEKCGTTSLYDDICRHPQVLGALEKEPYFFTEFYEFGSDWYLANFPRIKPGSSFKTGEASTTYLTDAKAPERIAADLPHARLMIIMRDPVARAVSQYNQLAKLGRISKSLEQAFADELKVLLAAQDPYTVRVQCHEAGRSCLWRSIYVMFLDQWLKHFPKEQLLALRSEDYFADADATMGKVWAFLGLDAPTRVDSSVSNQGEKIASISEDLAMELRAYFQPFNRRLSETLGWNCGWP
jgi:hypothetical protein